ncbi:MAG: response regulator [Candidatus Schekmanbacteria bacterium]|nr:response regulator [Candidatus Schekmanbacteria bacterium]
MSAGSEVERPSLGSPTVLLVDDRQENLLALESLLEDFECELVCAGSGQEALRHVRRRDFALVLLDVQMPEMDGFETAELMRGLERTRNIPIIFVTALSKEKKHIFRGYEAGAVDYLFKPLDPDVLRSKVRVFLELHQQKALLRSQAEQLERQNKELAEALHKLQATQQQLIVREKLASLGQLTAGIAHEIRNPLNFVTNFARFADDLIGELGEIAASDGAARTAEVLKVLGELGGLVKKISAHGRRASDIVTSMLEHARGSGGQRRAVALNPLVAESINFAYHAMRARDPGFDAAIETAYDEAVGEVRMAPTEISRVFINLIDNAFYALMERRESEDGGYRPVLRVSTENLGDRARVRVRDNGTGIPPEVAANLFSPFHTTKPAGVGTGLGLSISREIVVGSHQGEVELATEIGSFTEISVTLPK